MYLILAMKCQTAIVFVPRMNVVMNTANVKGKEQLKKARMANRMIEYFNDDCMVGMARYPDKYFDLAIGRGVMQHDKRRIRG